MFCIRTNGSEETYEALVSLFNERGVDLMTKAEFFDDTYERINPQINILSAMLYVMIAITVVGIFNVLAEQRIARKPEFEVLKQNGATKKDVTLLQAIEITYLLLCAILFAIVYSFIICRIMDMICVSFGMTIFPR